MSTNEKSKMGVYFRDPFGKVQHAAKYYRLAVPSLMLNKAYDVAYYVDDASKFSDSSIQAAINADISVFYAGTGEALGSLVDVIRLMKPGEGPNGEMVYPPSVVYDIDDNLDYVHPFNSAYNIFGTRMPDGSLVDISDDPERPTEITTTLANGETVKLWRDGDLVGEDLIFSLAENRKRVDGCHNVAKLAQGVTVPSEALAEYYRQVHGCKNVHVFPNTVVEADYSYPNLAPRDDGKVRILWQGGISHYPDWFPLKDALRAVAKKYPQATFVIWGSKFDWINDAIPEGQLEFHDWMDYGAYKVKRGILDCDINLAPLADAPFNWCKSGIKFYEAALGPKPEVTLAANVQPYSLEVEDGKNGLLYNTPEEFAQKLGTLIEDAELRKTLANNAKVWVNHNRTPDATIPGLMEFYQELRRQRRMEALAI